MPHNQRGIADDCAEEFLLGDLFDVGEAEFGEEFLPSISIASFVSYFIRLGRAWVDWECGVRWSVPYNASDPPPM